MNKLYPFLFVIILFSSCRMMLPVPIPMGASPNINPKPFVKLQTGQTFEAKTVSEEGKHIKTDSTSFKTKDVVAYSDGKSNYVNLGGGSFAEKIYEGDFNIYQIASTHTSTNYVGSMSGSGSSWSTSSHNHVSTYVQKSPNGELKRMNYSTLKQMLPRRDPGYKYLGIYKSERRINNYIMLGGLGLFLGGGILMGKSIMTPSFGAEGVGEVMLIGGGAAILAGAIRAGFNIQNLRKAIGRHNGLKIK